MNSGLPKQPQSTVTYRYRGPSEDYLSTARNLRNRNEPYHSDAIGALKQNSPRPDNIPFVFYPRSLCPEGRRSESATVCPEGIWVVRHLEVGGRRYGRWSSYCLAEEVGEGPSQNCQFIRMRPRCTSRISRGDSSIFRERLVVLKRGDLKRRIKIRWQPGYRIF